MKFGLKHYWKPTPIKMRKLGDSLVVACTSASGLSYMVQAPSWVVVLLVITGVCGKFITNYFTDES